MDFRYIFDAKKHGKRRYMFTDHLVVVRPALFVVGGLVVGLALLVVLGAALLLVGGVVLGLVVGLTFLGGKTWE